MTEKPKRGKRIPARRVKAWVLSREFYGGRRLLLGVFCWPGLNSPWQGQISTRLFATRKDAQAGLLTCCYKDSRVERVVVTLHVVRRCRRAG